MAGQIDPPAKMNIDFVFGFESKNARLQPPQRRRPLGPVARITTSLIFTPMPSPSAPQPPDPSHPTTRGRGAAINPPNRFERIHVAPDPDATPEQLGYEEGDAGVTNPRTQFFDDASESILSRNDSPDVPLTYSLNPYRGCEHGCAYCYARTYHDYLGWSSGLDFETRIMVKRRAPKLLRDVLEKPTWRPEAISFSGATDCYQPAERHFRLTRACLEVLREFRNPTAIITKNALVTRDIDLLADMARWQGATVIFTLTPLDTALGGQLEPRASRPGARLRALRTLADAGIPVGVMVAPIIPGLTDHEVPAILAAAAEAGATSAGYIVLRLPHTITDIFSHWLDTHAPSKKERVLSRVREIRGGNLNVSTWGERMKGEGIFADQIRQLFQISRRKYQLDRPRAELSTTSFRRPGGEQLTLL